VTSSASLGTGRRTTPLKASQGYLDLATYQVVAAYPATGDQIHDVKYGHRAAAKVEVEAICTQPEVGECIPPADSLGEAIKQYEGISLGQGGLVCYHGFTDVLVTVRELCLKVEPLVRSYLVKASVELLRNLEDKILPVVQGDPHPAALALIHGTYDLEILLVQVRVVP